MNYRSVLVLLIGVIFHLRAQACSPVLTFIETSDFKVELVEFKKVDDDYRKVVMIIPPTGGMNFIDESYAKRLCENDILALIVKNWTGDNEYILDLEIHARLYSRAQKAIELTVDKYRDYELGILGTSVGGIHAAISVSRFEEIKSCLLIVAGGNIASIITHSSQDILVDAKKKRFKKYDFKTLDEYEDALKSTLIFEPLDMPMSAHKKLGMIISMSDTLVPTKNQLELKEHWDPALISTSKLNHASTVVWTWLFKSETVSNFFN